MSDLNCINCNVRLSRMRRHSLTDESEALVNTIQLWTYPRDITPTDHICHACWQLATHPVTSDNMSRRQTGHRHICVVCGRSILRLSRRRVLNEGANEEQLRLSAVISRWIRPRELTSEDELCVPCWLKARRTRLPSSPPQPGIQHPNASDDGPQPDIQHLNSPDDGDQDLGLTCAVCGYSLSSMIPSDERQNPDNIALLLEHQQIGPLTEKRWQMGGGGGKAQVDNIAIHVTPPETEEDDEFMPTPAIRMRRKLSTPLSALPWLSDGLLGLQSRRSSPTRSLSPLDRTKRRFSTMVSSAAAAAVSRRLSATIGWCLATPTHVKPQIVRQGRALCLQYIKTQIRRSTLCSKKQIVMKRLQRMVETECGEEAISNSETGVLTALRALCAALERKRPDAFRHVARQATRAPSAMLRSDTALAELALALARRITRENITWSKIAAVYCVCGALAKEAAEAAEGEPALELVAAPAAAIADLLHEESGSWVASHGGWNGLIERLRASERDQRSEKNLRVLVSFFVLACLTLLLFRWVVQAHPAYNYNE